MRIVLTRHGHVEGIRPARFRGRAELELTPLGRRQAEAVAARIACDFPPQAVYSSPMKRCRDTAAAIAAAAGLEVQVLEALNDLDYGAWQGRTFEEVARSEPEAYALWRDAPDWVRFPGGESLQDLALRAADALRTLLPLHARDTVVLVGHDSVNHVLLLQALGLPLSAYRRLAQEPCALNLLDLDPSGARTVIAVNDTAHLRGLG
jgi:broad specificity phosphatase PhoE